MSQVKKGTIRVNKVVNTTSGKNNQPVKRTTPIKRNIAQRNRVRTAQSTKLRRNSIRKKMHRGNQPINVTIHNIFKPVCNNRSGNSGATKQKGFKRTGHFVQNRNKNQNSQVSRFNSASRTSRPRIASNRSARPRFASRTSRPRIASRRSARPRIASRRSKARPRKALRKISSPRRALKRIAQSRKAIRSIANPRKAIRSVAQSRNTPRMMPVQTRTAPRMMPVQRYSAPRMMPVQRYSAPRRRNRR